MPPSQLALFALCWGFHLVVLCQVSYFGVILIRLGEDQQVRYPIDGTKIILTFLWHTTPLGGLFELPVLVCFSDLGGLLTPLFLIIYRQYALCPASLSRHSL